MNSLGKKTGLVTGASKGIGFEVARAMIREGMNVVLTARNSAEVEEAARRLSEEGPGEAMGLAGDVRDYDSQRAAVERSLERFGSLDVVVANAGVGGYSPVDEMPLEQWQAIIDTNLTGAFYTVKASVDALKRSSGYLITIASLAGANFFPGGGAYNASKFGLVGFTQAVMLDLRKHDIKVSTIMPGSVATHFGGNPPTFEESWKIQPEDIGEMVIYLLKVPERTLPSKIEVRPSVPPSAR